MFAIYESRVAKFCNNFSHLLTFLVKFRVYITSHYNLLNTVECKLRGVGGRLLGILRVGNVFVLCYTGRSFVKVKIYMTSNGGKRSTVQWG